MKFERAEEIYNSPSNYEVIYDGNPVWINSLNPNKKSANIKFLNHNAVMDVPVGFLIEGKKLSS
ncbi:H-type small acid-soluble spore protein [Thermoanaerobacterium thermosaccharolyticum]|uniref:Small acid-soluble spore protein, H-type n=1 Tax=Thermoanaerobacterium thermosaccharolyticum M0795 TaxID=698948 RepID=L0IPU5_THETR|nr:H-type small acid-soluble spore protein [Thermoanaerobacterium thermosaccharolyticum]AGB20246.1 small acid-soluble spore protein, H-type [Thermoanaerobacterium thermosaccharolyticum M0795]